MPPADVELRQAAETLRKIADFLDARRGWTADEATLASLATMTAACERCLRSVDLLRASVGELPTLPPATPPKPLPATALDAVRVGRFAGWLGELAGWLEGQQDGAVSSVGAVHLAELSADLELLRELTGARATPAPPPVMPTAASPPPPPRRPQPEELEAVEVPAGPPLILVNSIEAPLLRETVGQYELSDRARKRLVRFLDCHGIESDGHNLRRLELKIVRWIEATPDGQALVLKVGGLHGRSEPYPSYVARERAEELEAAVGAAAL